MNIGIGTTVKIAFYSTLIESIIGVVLCALYVLFHFCAITVSCPGSSKVEQVAFVFYTTYINEKDGCKVTNDDDGSIQEITSNTNNLTQPQIIFFWQVLLLLLYLAWVGTALMLQQVEKKSRSAIPWIFVTFLVIVADFTASALSLTDYYYEETQDIGFSCPLDIDWAVPRKSWTTTILFLLFSRGGVIWILNLWFLLTITAFIIEKGQKVAPATPQVQTNKNPMNEYWATPPGHNLNLEDQELPEMNTFSQQGRQYDQQMSNNNKPRTTNNHPTTSHYQPPTSNYQSPTNHYQPPVNHNHPTSNHYQPPSNDYQPSITRNQDASIRQENQDPGLRRPQSFAERIRNADNSEHPTFRDSQLWSYANPGVRKELQTRGESIRPTQPDKDVDSAFNFLETYSIKEDGPEPGMETESVKQKSYSKYLSRQLEVGQVERQGIPRAKVPTSSSRPSSVDNGQRSQGR